MLYIKTEHLAARGATVSVGPSMELLRKVTLTREIKRSQNALDDLEKFLPTSGCFQEG